MLKSTLTVLLLWVSVSSFGQYKSFNEKYFGDLKGCKKLYVMLPEDAEEQAATMRQAFGDVWKMQAVEFVNADDWDALREKNEEKTGYAYFFIRTVETKRSPSRGAVRIGTISYSYYFELEICTRKISFGKRRSSATTELITRITLDRNFENFPAYPELRSMLLMLQDKIKKGEEFSPGDEFVDSEIKKLKKAVLYIDERCLDKIKSFGKVEKRRIAELVKDYPYKCKFESSEKIQRIISESNGEPVYYLYFSFSEKNCINIYDAVSGKLIYQENRLLHPYLKDSDLEKIAEAIEDGGN